MMRLASWLASVRYLAAALFVMDAACKPTMASIPMEKKQYGNQGFQYDGSPLYCVLCFQGGRPHDDQEHPCGLTANVIAGSHMRVWPPVLMRIAMRRALVLAALVTSIRAMSVPMLAVGMRPIPSKVTPAGRFAPAASAVPRVPTAKAAPARGFARPRLRCGSGC